MSLLSYIKPGKPQPVGAWFEQFAQVSWPRVAGARYYEVKRDDGKAARVDARHIHDPLPARGQTCIYYVRAVGWLQKGSWSDPVEAGRIPLPKPEPPQPSPQPPAPAPNPGPQPTPALKPNVLNPARLCIWNEAGGAHDFGIKSATCLSLHGRAGAGQVRIAHPWYDPWKAPINAAEIERRMRAAKGEGCVAFGVDFEGWMWSESVAAQFATAAKAVGLPLICVPKVSNDLGGKYLAGGFEADVRIVERYFDAAIGWGYGCDGPAYLEWMRRWRAAGFKGQLGCTQDQVRDGNGYHGARHWRSVVDMCRREGYLFMWFAPNHSSAALVAEMRSIWS
jgi:hypothetical protein